MPVIEETTLRQLEQLVLVANQVRIGLMKGDRRSRNRGSSVEFADYRSYSRGDDLRRLDWNIYARFEKSFIKLLEDEEDLSVHILVDASQSMNWPIGDMSNHKYQYALRLAAALGYIALGTGDQVTVTVVKNGLNQLWGPHRGRQQGVRLFEFLDRSSTSGTTDLNIALREFGFRSQRPGLAILLSDLFSPDGYEDGVNRLRSQGYEVAIIHILSPDEIVPSPAGDVRLVDVESGKDAELTLNPSTVSEYRQRILTWQRKIGSFCRQRDVRYVPVTTEIPWNIFLMQTLTGSGLVA